MKRRTGRNAFGEVYIVGMGEDNILEKVRSLATLLAEYEDTGLTPKQVRELKAAQFTAVKVMRGSEVPTGSFIGQSID